jgi:putative polyketide hydroxylase
VVLPFIWILIKFNTRNHLKIPMNNITKKIPVLIIGAGPVGLSMALCLARQNVPSLVVEKHSGRTPHPRARGVSMRTMELFRQWGNIEELLKYEFPKEAIRFIWSESLQGNEVTRVEMKGLDNYTHGPIGASFVTQDCVEEYLHHTLQCYHKAEIQFSREMISFEENDTGVTVKLLNRENNKEELVRAQYLIAADGARSSIRKQLEIEMEGSDNLARSCSVYCEFDISQWTKHRPSVGYFFTDPKILGRSLFTAYGKNRWIVGLNLKPENTKEDFSDEYCLSEIRRVLDMPNLDIKIINKSFWTMAAQVAKQYRHGRVFLVGDAAHRLPPTGGLGMNTGVADAHNLAWKLAFVINHQASDVLLDTYYDERAPIAKRNIEWSTENAKRFFDIFKAIQTGDHEMLKIKLHEQQKNLNYEGLDLGFIYHSKAVQSENDQVISVLPDKYIPTTLPGSRAPYVQLIKDDEAISTLDLFENDYVLLVGSDGHKWQTAANELALTLPIKNYRVAHDGDLIDPENVWHKLYEVTTTGAVLVRPDGHVAWRSKETVNNPIDVLAEIFHISMNGINQ